MNQPLDSTRSQIPPDANLAAIFSEQFIDQLYDVAETLNVASIVLARGNVTDKTCGSISWLMGSMSDKVGEAISALETINLANWRAQS